MTKFVILTLLALATVATAREAGKLCETNLEPSSVYPKSIKLKSLKRTVQLNAWIHLSKLSSSQLSDLLSEIKNEGYIAEFENDGQGLIQSFRSHGNNAFSIALIPEQEVIVSLAPQSISYRLRINAKPSTPIAQEVFLTQSTLADAFKRTGLSAEDIALITSQSKAVMRFPEFLTSPKFRKTKDKKVILLGHDDNLYQRLANERNFKHFNEIYQRYYSDGTLEGSGGPWDHDDGPLPEVTDRFMNEISHYQMVFLIPENFHLDAGKAGKTKPGYTYEEWLWLKNHPEAMKDVVFVLDSEFSLGPRLLFQRGVSNEKEKQRQLSDLFKNPTSYYLK